MSSTRRVRVAGVSISIPGDATCVPLAAEPGLESVRVEHDDANVSVIELDRALGIEEGLSVLEAALCENAPDAEWDGARAGEVSGMSAVVDDLRLPEVLLSIMVVAGGKGPVALVGVSKAGSAGALGFVSGIFSSLRSA